MVAATGWLRAGGLSLVAVATALGCRGVIGIEPLRAAAGGDDGGGVLLNGSPEAGAPGFCDEVKPTPAFCADFENGELTDGWLNSQVKPDPGVGGGSVIEPDFDVDAPRGHRAAQVRIPALVTVNDNALAFLLAPMPTSTPSEIDLSWDIKVTSEQFVQDTATGRTGKATILSIDFGTAGTIFVFRDLAGPGIVVFDGNTPHNPVDVTRPFPVGEWKRLRAIVQNKPVTAGGDGDIHLWIDGIPAGTATIPASYRLASAPKVLFGVPTGQGPLRGFRASIDNVTVDYIY